MYDCYPTIRSRMHCGDRHEVFSDVDEPGTHPDYMDLPKQGTVKVQYVCSLISKCYIRWLLQIQRSDGFTACRVILIARIVMSILLLLVIFVMVILTIWLNEYLCMSYHIQATLHVAIVFIILPHTCDAEG